MTSIARLHIDGTRYDDFNNGSIVKSTGEDNTSSTCNFSFKNYNALYTTNFSVGDTVEVWIGDGNYFVIDDCESTSNWNKLNCRLALNPTYKTEGLYSIAYVTGFSGFNYFTVDKTFSTEYTFFGKLQIDIYLDASELGYYNSVELRFGSDSSNYYTKTFTNLISGWQTIEIEVGANNVTETGAPDRYNCDFLLMKVDFSTRPSSSTFLFDNIRLSNISEKIFNGRIEDVDIQGKQVDSTITISGRDYTSALQDKTIPPEIYTNMEVEDIIDDFMAKYIVDLTYNKVAMGVTISRIAFNHISVFDALRKLADQSNAYFYVDTDNVLHFLKKGTTSSGQTLDSTNTLSAKWKTTRQEVVNQVWVYGDKILTGVNETFTGDGIGSVFTLGNRPHNTSIFVSGTILGGGVENLVTIPPSGVQYLVNFYDKTIIFTSGTDAGYNIPGSLVNIQANYDKSSPIIKFGRDRSSESAYGVKEKIIQDANINDPDEAVNRVKSELEQYANPKTQGTVWVDGIKRLNAGETIIVNLSKDSILNQTYTIMQVTYNLTKESLFADNFITVKLNKRIGDVTDTIKKLIMDVKDLQSGQIDDSEVLTRVEFATGSIGMRSTWFVQTRSIGSSFTLDSATNGALDDSGVFLDIENTFVNVHSGGYFA